MKTYDISLITKLRINISLKKNTTYWAFVNSQWKRISYIYFLDLKLLGIETVDTDINKQLVTNSSVLSNKEICSKDRSCIKLYSKGRYGLLIQNYILTQRYGISCPQQPNGAYDLTSKLNIVSSRNVSIKASKTNTIYCSSVFNFLNSINLELVVVNYKVVSEGKVLVKEYYFFSNLDLFFVNLSKTINFTKLSELVVFLETIKAPFSKEERIQAHHLAKLVSLEEYSGFKVAVKLSSTNKRLQCTLKLTKLCELVSFTCVTLNKDTFLFK